MKKFLILTFIYVVSSTIFAQSNNIPNGTILDSATENGHSILIRKHEQTLTIDYSAQDFQMVLYDSPLSKNRIGDLQKKDIIQIKEIYMINGKEMWLNISSSETEGYILFQSSENIYDFYADDLWQPVETIQSGDKTWHTLKCDQGFFIYTNLNIRDKPGLAGTKIGMITANNTNYVSVKTSEVTVEKERIDGKSERWAKIEYKGVTGWVFGGYLSFERGGPRFITPESRLAMSLGAGI